jgi:hypothetical protein
MRERERYYSYNPLSTSKILLLPIPQPRKLKPYPEYAK